jgi:hypothetical protein
MDEHTNSSNEGNRHDDSLQTYLCDHTAGAQHAIELFETLKHLHARTSLGQYSAELLQQLREDLTVLERLAASTGATGFQLKELAGWVGDKLSRLKLAPVKTAFHTFEALEFLSLGILGKRALWRTLKSVSSCYPELEAVDLDQLLERAEAQYEATEKMRLQMAVRAFAVDLPQ